MYKLKLASIIAFFSVFMLSCSSGGNKNESTAITNSLMEVSAEYLIIPGQSVGKLKLDSNAAYVYEMWGKPDAGDAAMGKTIATWYDDPDLPKQGVSIYTAQATENPPALIKQIRVTHPKYQTENGIGIGTDFNTIQQTYHLEEDQGYKNGLDSISIFSDRSGISFEIDKSQKCIGILVYSKGSVIPGTYLKFLP